jgi:putative ABC transport system substrate-binding protein
MSKKIIGIALSALLFALSFPAEAQQPAKIPRLGFLDTSTASASAVRLEAFWQEIRKLGWIEGKNIIVEYRFQEQDNKGMPELAADLVRLKVDLIVVVGTRAAVAAKNAITTIPIVLTAVGDPVAAGLITSLARPEGNVTGLSSFSPELAGKRLVKLRPVERQVTNETDAERLFRSLKRGDVDGVFIASPNLRSKFPSLIVTLAAEKRLPLAMHRKEWVEKGALFSYGFIPHQYARDGAAYIDKILKGTKAGDLPVQEPPQLEFIISLKTAKQIGLTIPPNVLARADNVIK